MGHGGSMRALVVREMRRNLMRPRTTPSGADRSCIVGAMDGTSLMVRWEGLMRIVRARRVFWCLDDREHDETFRIIRFDAHVATRSPTESGLGREQCDWRSLAGTGGREVLL